MAEDKSYWEGQLGALVGRIDGLAPLYDRVYEAATPESSLRFADDAATWPLAVGQHAQYCLIQAIDMCQGLRELVTNEKGLQIPLAATYPLARAAIESASTAVWMMQPSDRRTRVVRRLQAAQDELNFEKAFMHEVAASQPGPQGESTKRKYAKDARGLKVRIGEIARVHEIEQSEYLQMPGWRDIVDAAAPILHGERRALLVAAWRFTSGLTHPSFTRGRIAHAFVPSQPDSPSGEITANVEWIVSTGVVAEALTRRALLRLAHTKMLPNQEHPVREPRHL
ncbi:hypothetical protein [Microbacterium arborescens]|uniref:hypothetical protein n=1 Tax=Microbacterium arborescens TaxID=33883 RepID=UPI0027D8CC90|nr:hypothetical protein [Microbacterium arborescens]